MVFADPFELDVLAHVLHRTGQRTLSREEGIAAEQ